MEIVYSRCAGIDVSKRDAKRRTRRPTSRLRLSSASAAARVNRAAGAVSGSLIRI